MPTGPCECNHMLYEHEIYHKPAQGAHGYIYVDFYMILGCKGMQMRTIQTTK